MTTNSLTLFCLVDGEKTAFPVTIDTDKTIGELKKAIRDEKANYFHDVDADELSLWHVSVPVLPKKDRKPIWLADVPKKEELDETDDIADVFTDVPPKKTIHIIVQRPAPQVVNAPVPSRSLTPPQARDTSRSATPVQLKSVQDGDIEKELVAVLKAANGYHISHIVDPKDVEASQREKLGPFYKRALPYHQTASDISLVMLGLELDKQAKTGDGETLRSIVEDDIGKHSDHRVVAMVAPSGSGKTATVVDLASRHFVIYSVCCSPSPAISPGFSDPNFIALAKDVERIYRKIINGEQGGLRDPLDIDSEVKIHAGERVELEFLARLLFLQHLLNINPSLEPQQFFREQTTGGATAIARFVNKLQEYDNRAIRAMLRETQINLHTLLVPRRLGLVIALDEAQVAVTGILADKLI
ncbi:hypothetical protein BGW42_007040 [Actinomortierella wolfii]|nr:hypothetical protein BGW42_007040 [Actinomortierella wolfii]